MTGGVSPHMGVSQGSLFETGVARGAPLKPLTTRGAKLKFRVHGPTATEAFSDELLFGRNPRRSPTLIEDSAAASTFEERPSFPDREEGNKEETHVMVQPHEPGRGESAAGTAPRLVVHLDLPGLHASNKNEGPSPPLQKPVRLVDPVKRLFLSRPHVLPELSSREVGPALLRPEVALIRLRRRPRLRARNHGRKTTHHSTSACRHGLCPSGSIINSRSIIPLLAHLGHPSLP